MSHMIRSYYRCCCINEPVICSHGVYLKLGHRFHALLKVCSDRDDTAPLTSKNDQNGKMANHYGKTVQIINLASAGLIMANHYPSQHTQVGPTWDIAGFGGLRWAWAWSGLSNVCPKCKGVNSGHGFCVGGPVQSVYRLPIMVYLYHAGIGPV